jgi:hypothetical protein
VLEEQSVVVHLVVRVKHYYKLSKVVVQLKT